MQHQSVEAAGIRKPHFLSLRWKALTALSLVLVLVNASLAYLAYGQSARQFELQQTEVRERQGRQLRDMVAGHAVEMSRLASLVPLMGPNPPLADLPAQLRHALGANGAMLDLEWDIRSVHWLSPQGETSITWPEQTEPLPPELVSRIADAPEKHTTLLSCHSQCRQYLATPLLWGGAYGGSLVLARSLADSLLAFNELTGADVAVLSGQKGSGLLTGPGSEPPTGVRFPAITHAEHSDPILSGVVDSLVSQDDAAAPVLVQRGGGLVRDLSCPGPGRWGRCLCHQRRNRAAGGDQPGDPFQHRHRHHWALPLGGATSLHAEAAALSTPAHRLRPTASRGESLSGPA